MHTEYRVYYVEEKKLIDRWGVIAMPDPFAPPPLTGFRGLNHAARIKTWFLPFPSPTDHSLKNSHNIK